MLTLLDTHDVVRNGSTWKYDIFSLVTKLIVYTCSVHFLLKESLSCREAINKVIVEACSDASACINVTADIADAGRRVVANFSNLIENRKYTVIVHVLYNGGIEQQSQPVESSECRSVPVLMLHHLCLLTLGTFDIQNASISMLTTNKLCLIVGYIEGHETPLYTFLRLSCLTTKYVQNIIIEGIEGCINIESLNSSQICSLSVTDVDALDIVDTTPAIVITEILITRNITSTTLQSTTSSTSVRVTSHLLPTSTLVLTTCTMPSIMPIGE